MKSVWPPHFAAGEPPTKKGRTPQNGIRPSCYLPVSLLSVIGRICAAPVPAAGMPQLLRSQPHHRHLSPINRLIRGGHIHKLEILQPLPQLCFRALQSHVRFELACGRSRPLHRSRNKKAGPHNGIRPSTSNILHLTSNCLLPSTPHFELGQLSSLALFPFYTMPETLSISL